MPRNNVTDIAQRNALLKALPLQAYERLQPHLIPALLSRGQVLQDCDQDISWIYFPASGLVSLVVVMFNGVTVESSLVGNDGVVGIELPLGMLRPACRAVVHIPGGALRLRAEVLLSEFCRGGELHRLLLHCAQRLMAHLCYIAACNRLHSVEQRLCRWLLQRVDRTPGNELRLTQEFIASMLGDRRETINLAERHLQRLGFIRHSRGRVAVLNRQGLEVSACECYKALKSQTESLVAAVDARAA